MKIETRYTEGSNNLKMTYIKETNQVIMCGNAGYDFNDLVYIVNKFLEIRETKVEKELTANDVFEGKTNG